MKISNQATLRQIALGVTSLVAVFVIAVSVAAAFTGPASSGGVGSGAVASDGQNNIAVGTSTTNTTTKLNVVASSTATTAYGLQVLQPNGTSIFYVRNDGAVSVPGTLTAGNFTGTTAANNVSAGTFGANTGGGNYTFPATLTTSKLRIGTASSTNVFDSYDVWGSHLYFAGNGDNTLHIENTYQPGAEAGIYLTNYNEGQSLSISTNAGSYGPSIVGYPNLVLQDGNAGGVISLSTEAFNVDGRWTLLGATTQVFKVTDNTSQLLVVTRGGQVQVASGNATLPAYSYVTDHNTGSFNPGTNIWAVSTNATERMRVGSTGNVGIGTTTANFPLTVAGTIYSSSGGFKFPDGTTQTTAFSGAGSTVTATNVSAGAFGANTGNGNYSFPASLGISNGSPNSLLHVGAGTDTPFQSVHTAYISSNGDSDLIVRDSTNDVEGMVYAYSGGVLYGSSTNHNVIFRTNNSDRMTITNTGNVGIGLTPGSYGLDVYNANPGIRVRDTGGRTYIDTSVRSGVYGTTGVTSLNGDRLIVDTDGPEGNNDTVLRHTVNSIFIYQSDNTTYPGGLYVRQKGGTYGLVVNQDTNGNVGINDTNPSYKLSVNGTIWSESGGFRFPDGTTQTTAAASATIPANNVSAGSFGGNTGGGNYTFPGTLSISTTLSGNLLSINTTGASQARIGASTGSGIAGINFTSNSNTWYLDNRGSNDVSMPANRLGLFNTGGTELVSFLQGGSMVFGGTGMSANPNFTANNAIVFNSGFTSTSSISWAQSGSIYWSIFRNNSSPNSLTIQSQGNGYESVQFRDGYAGGAPIRNQIAMTSGQYTFFNSGSNVGINTATPGYGLEVNGTMGVSGTLTIGGGTGKINVGTVDPIYQIGGEKFATYLPGIIGVKEEIAGDLEIPCKEGRCEKTINFGNEQKGSDLWLFGKVTNIQKHLPDASILLTPAFDGRVSYTKGNGELTILATPFAPADSVEVSYRFTAPRFDADKWSNRTTDEAAGFIIP